MQQTQEPQVLIESPHLLLWGALLLEVVSLGLRCPSLGPSPPGRRTPQSPQSPHNPPPDLHNLQGNCDLQADQGLLL